MSTFHYRAVSAQGEMVEGRIEAPDRPTVVEKLRDQGLFPLNVDEGAGAQTSILQMEVFGSRTVSQRDLAVATGELATLLHAGLPLDRALRILIDVAESQPLRELFSRVLERVQGGVSLAEAIEGEGAVFPRYYAGMVRAGEAGGTLHDVLVSIAAFMERMRALRESVKSALIYPSILVVMAVATVIVMFAVVLPRFRPMFEEMGDELPILTRGALVTGDIVAAWWWVAGLVLIVFVLALRRRLRDPGFRQRWDAFKLRLPLFGPLLRKIETARFGHTLAMLLRGGQPLPEALAIVRNVIVNSSIREALGQVSGRLRQGQGLSTPLAEAGIFPNLAIHLIRVGEEGGQLESMMEQLATTYDREVRDTTQRLIGLLVPVLTVSLGAVIALIIMSVLGAFLSVNQIVG